MSANRLATVRGAPGLFLIFSEADHMDERPVVTDSRQRVALELTQVIDGREHRTRIEKPTARTYDLTPYGQCLKVVSDEAGKRARAKLNLRKCGIRPGECGASR